MGLLRMLPVAAGWMVFTLGEAARADAPLPLTDNAQPPFMGVYEACSKDGVARLPAYLAFLNRKKVWVHDTIPFGSGGTWTHISGQWQDWMYLPWIDWLKRHPGDRLVLSVPLLPGPPDGSGPGKEAGAGQPVSLAQGAAGAYNGYFKSLAETLVGHHLESSILRLGWEWNGNWYAWKVVTAEDARNFAAYWRQIVDTMRAVPGAGNLKFDWNATSGFKTAYAPEEAYPGDAYVDYVGIDVYDSTWAKTAKYPEGCYPLPAGAGDAERADRREAAWQAGILSADTYGVAYWQKLADDHGKPLTIPEWSVMSRPDGHAGGDNPAFIRHLCDYIRDPAHHVYFASYFDANAGGEGDCRISGADGQPPPFPQASAMMKQLFSLPETAAASP